MVSDTWSTDVLASDTETVEQAEAPLSSRQLLDLCTVGTGTLEVMGPLHGRYWEVLGLLYSLWELLGPLYGQHWDYGGTGASARSLEVTETSVRQ